MKLTYADGAVTLDNLNASGAPASRNAHISCAHGDNFFVFGGSDEDNDKLSDMNIYSLSSNTWQEVKPTEADYNPVGRSGAAGCLYNNQVYIFGGILEVTKELNDMITFDVTTKKFDTFEKEERRTSKMDTSKLSVDTKKD